MSPEAFEEFQDLLPFVANSDSEVSDVWVPIWRKPYYSRAYYSFCFRELVPPKPFNWIWKSKLTMKAKVFIWLMLADRLNTHNMLKRRHYQVQNNDFSCCLCSRGEEETMDHLFASCEFSTRCWCFLKIHWPADVPCITALSSVKAAFNNKLFFEVFALGAWNIWKQRNDFIFEGVQPSFQGWKARFKSDFALLGSRVPQTLSPLFESLLDSFH